VPSRRLPFDRREVRERWDEARPILLARAAAASVARLRPAIGRTLRLLERLRRGEEFSAALFRRLSPRGPFVRAGVSVDLGDPLEIEKVHVDAVGSDGRTRARDLFVKLSRVGSHPRDDSIRIRFSFGSERLGDWARGGARSLWADRLAEEAFPECSALARHGDLIRTIASLAGRPVRFSERILYANAPRGGSSFHHDAEPGQLGVAYAQLSGETAWLAVRKRELAELLRSPLAPRALRRSAGTNESALRMLDDPDEPRLRRWLDDTPALTAALAARGALLLVAPGDVLLLPSHGPDDAAWHSVFGLGTRPGLALSFGIFAS
jgi:hypothetical protein